MAESKKKVVIVGAGPSGLVALKEMLEAGHDAVAVEAKGYVGGVFGGDGESSGYESLMLTTSNYFMAFSDFPPEKKDPIRYWSKREYVEYLDRYVERFALKSHIRLKTKVVRAEKKNGTWRIEISSKKSFWFETLQADALCVCTGSNHEPKKNDAGPFRGKTLHSSEYKSNKTFRNQTVLVVGFGESSADVAPEIAVVAKRCVLWGRRPPSFAPRFPALMASDPNHDEFKLLCDPVKSRQLEMPDFLEYMTTPRVQQEASVGLIGANKQAYFSAVANDPKASPQSKLSLQLIQEATKNSYYRADQSLWVTKNGRPLLPIVEGRLGLIVAPEAIFSTNSVHFPRCTRIDLFQVDNQPYTIDQLDTVVWCTGFLTKFEWLINEPSASDPNPRTWYKHCFPPNHPTADLAYLGWARGQQGGIPQMAELLARYHAQLLTGSLKLPLNYSDLALREGRFETRYYCESPSLTALVDYPSFCDSVAGLLHCKPSPPLFNPQRFFQYWTYPLWAYWYRAVGPGSRPDVLEDVLDRFPLRTKGLKTSPGAGIPLIGVFPFALIGLIQALLQKPLSFITLLLPTNSKLPGLTFGWIWLKPKHFVLHGNKLTLKSALITS